jgi:Protein of unknown function (DUF1592)/Protein of unknown function (DUF1588)/Protein of unknown function (DUF1595)/Protein of unknown function (DUF1585)
MFGPRNFPLGSPWHACVIALAMAGCTGVVSGPSGQSSTGAAGSTGAGTGVGTGVAGGGVTGTGSAGSGSAVSCNAAAPDPGDAPLTRLTQQQYLNTINDLFGKIDLSSVYPITQSASQFGLAQADVGGADLNSYERAAEIVSAAVVANTTTMNSVAPCAAGATTAAARACATQFLQGFATRIYRAPIAAADMDRHLALYDAGAVNGGYPHGVQLLLTAMLQSSRFLYRVELGTSTAVGPTAVKLSDYELAARLSYGLWNTMPDATLSAAAAAGKLETSTDVSAQLQRMLQDPRGATMVPQFLGSWIALPQLAGVAKDSAAYPAWTPALQAAMVTQAQSFFSDLLANQGGTLKALLTSQTVFTNSATAVLTGASASTLPTDGSFQSSQNPVAAGLLTLPAFLATQAKADQSSPIYRGKFVREQFFCQELPSPPANVPPAPVITPGVSTRQRLAEHEVNSSCAACHTLMDPIGFGFESFDGIGAYRTMDNGKPVDASGMLTGTDVDGAFNGVAQLGGMIAKSAIAESCVGTQWFRYAMARAESVADTCSLQLMQKTFHDSGADLRTLPMALVQTPAFMYRRPLAQGSN